MTKGLFGSLAAFNTVLHLSAPDSYSTRGMSSTGHPETNGMMSNLVAGSVADYDPQDQLRYGASLNYVQSLISLERNR